MKFDLLDNLLMFIPEDDVDVFNLGEIIPSYSNTKVWKTVEGKTKLKSIVVNVHNLDINLRKLWEKNRQLFAETVIKENGES